MGFDRLTRGQPMIACVLKLFWEKEALMSVNTHIRPETWKTADRKGRCEDWSVGCCIPTRLCEGEEAARMNLNCGA